jgi:predicted enzyme related to lactoylglutathione lyase
MMAKVTGVGGIFFKAEDPGKQYEWYEKHLGIAAESDGSGAMFHWRQAENPKEKGMTVWSIFPWESPYFGPETNSFMVNYRVDDLDALLERLAAEGVEIDPKRENFEYGRFAWIVDPEGNRIELWEPPKGS